MRDALSLFKNALANSLTPEFMKKDKMSIDQVFSSKTQEAFTEFLDHQLGDADVGSRHKFNGYESMRDYFGLDNFNDKDTFDYFKSFYKNNPGENIKMALGEFTVERTKQGYRVIDTYNFNPNIDSRGRQLYDDQGKERQVGFLQDVVGNLTKPYSMMHAIGGLALSEDGSNAIEINWEIPHGQEVARKQFASSVLTALGD